MQPPLSEQLALGKACPESKHRKLHKPKFWVTLSIKLLPWSINFIQVKNYVSFVSSSQNKTFAKEHIFNLYYEFYNLNCYENLMTLTF